MNLVDLHTVAPAFLAFFVAAFLKGITGLGFSTICLPILTTFLDLKVSIPLVIVPSLASNVLVMAQAGRFTEAFGRFWPIYISAIPGLVLGVSVLHAVQSSLSRAVLGGVLLVYALWALRAKAVVLPTRAAAWLAGPVGFATGVVNGITGSQVMPVLPFFLALRLDTDLFVQAINLSFTLSSVVMLGLLSGIGLLTAPIAITAGFGVFPVALGVVLGGKLRRALAEERFRRIVLLFLMVVGVSLIVRI